MSTYEQQKAFAEANPEIAAQLAQEATPINTQQQEDREQQQQDEREEQREETFQELLAKYVELCREDGYYVTYNAQGDVRFASDLHGVKEAPARAMHRGFKKYAEKKGYKGAYPKDSMSRVLYALEEGLTFAEHTFFEPGAKEYKVVDAARGMYARNTWKPFQYSGVETADGNPPNLDIFFERARRIYGKYTDKHLDRLAYMVQYPGRRLPQYEYVMGSQGCGKSTYYTYYVLPLFSGQYQNVNKLPTGRFDLSNYKEVEFALFDDPVGSEKARQELKSVLTSSVLGAEVKYGALEKQVLYFNSALLCNPEQRFPVHREDRRPFVVIAPDWDYASFRDNVEMPELARCGEDPENPDKHGAYIDALHDYLLHREIDAREVARIVRTEDFYVVAGMDLTDAVAIMEAAELYSVVTAAKIQEVMQYDPRQKPNFNRIGEVLRNHGWLQCRVKFNAREKPSAWYNPKDFPDGKPQNKELRTLFNVERIDDLQTSDLEDESVDNFATLAQEIEEKVNTPSTSEVPAAPAALEASGSTVGQPETNSTTCQSEEDAMFHPDLDVEDERKPEPAQPATHDGAGFWMHINGVRVWYDPSAGSGEKPVEILSDDDLPEWAKAPCPELDGLPEAQAGNVAANNVWRVWDAANDCWVEREPIALN